MRRLPSPRGHGQASSLRIGQGCGAGLEHRAQLSPRRRASSNRRITAIGQAHPDFAGGWRFGPPFSLVVMPPVLPHWPPLQHMAEACQFGQDPAPPRLAGLGIGAGIAGLQPGPIGEAATSFIARSPRITSAEKCVVVAKRKNSSVGQGVVFR